MYNGELPIIRLEIEGMRRTIHKALLEHQAQMDEDIKEAVDTYCTEENIKAVIHKAAREALDAVIVSEVKSFFTYGEGRKAVAAAVKEAILKKETYTLLDDVDCDRT